MGKQTGTVRGLHNAGINFLYAAAGLFTPEHIGVVQYYGAAADAADRDQAGELALRGLASIEAAMANFPQSRLEAPNTDNSGSMIVWSKIRVRKYKASHQV